jgi:hypothetical protein
MGRAVSVLVIFFLSYGLALLIAPPDPFMFHLTAALLFLFGVLSYVLGLREARDTSHASESHHNHNMPQA